MKKYDAPLVTSSVNDGRVIPASIAAGFALGALAAIGAAATKGDRIITPGLAGLEPCVD
ncbi:MAG: hypothetical protein IJS28_00340 [Synergistaceae bacterium]|nr:hypothetical protein [Synergistaceae bacterium]